MPRRRLAKQPDAVLCDIRDLLDQFEANREGMSVREQILLLCELRHQVLTLGVSAACEMGAPSQSGMDRILWYFNEHLGEVIAGDELAVVSGISEYRRRTGELRIEKGHQLFTGSNAHKHRSLPYDLRPEDYIYTSEEVDKASAKKWKILNEIRRSEGGLKVKARALLKARLGEIVDVSELRYISQDRYEPRRIRELVTQEGYMIATRNRGFTGLKNGQYMLLKMEPRFVEEHDRTIPEKVEQAVLERDQNYCRVCHWHPSKWTPNDPRIPELHHINEHRRGGLNVADNLITLCSKCHDKFHAGKLKLPPKLEEFKPLPNG